MKHQWRHSIVVNTVLSAVLAAILTTTIATSSGAANKAPSLASLTLPSIAGFSSDKTDQTGGGPTGSINFNEASSADCDPTALNRKLWVASELRYFDNNRAEPETYVILCVTQFRTAAAAAANRKSLVGLGGSKQLTTVPIPGTYLKVVGPANILYFVRGDYFVYVVSLNLTTEAMSLPLGTNVAHREYLRLAK
jgi:hypothetical protein